MGITEEGEREPGDVSGEEENGTPCVEVECGDLGKKTSREGGCMVCN